MTTNTHAWDVKTGCFQDHYAMANELWTYDAYSQRNWMDCIRIVCLYEWFIQYWWWKNDFIAPNINVTELDEGAKPFDIVLEKRDAKLNTVMSNSFGFGGVNACLIFKKWEG